MDRRRMCSAGGDSRGPERNRGPQSAIRSEFDDADLSFVASKVKAQKVFDFLAEKGIPRDWLSQIRSPAGLHLGGLSPQEIAVSILAEIVQMRKTKKTPIAGKEIAGTRLDKSEGKDPVCGMLVNKGEAKYISDYRGQSYYFCCAGCKQAFDQQPETYLNSAPL